MNATLKCLIVDDEVLSRKIIEQFVEKTGFITCVKSCANPIEAVEYLSENTCDIIFLDIEMPEMSGLEFIVSLREKPQIILVTSKEEYALKAFDLDVCDYLLKPPVYARFLKAVTKAKEIIQREADLPSSSEFLFVKVDTRIVKIEFNEIDYIKGTGDYVTIYAGKSQYIVHSTMSGIENKLPGNYFVRVHKSYIINLKKISSIEDTTISIAGQIIPIGGIFKNDFYNRLSLL